MSTVVTERVLVVPTELFHGLGHFQGFSPDVERYLPTLFDPAHTSYRPRGEVEEDPSFKQLIPYVIFCHRSPGGVELFQYLRGKGQGEGRLHSKRSIGVGGHISSEDASAAGLAYQEGMRRELDEEVVVETPFSERLRRLDQRRRVGSRPRPFGGGPSGRGRAAGRSGSRARSRRSRFSAAGRDSHRPRSLGKLVAILPGRLVRLSGQRASTPWTDPAEAAGSGLPAARRPGKIEE